ncbi:MAG: hypothetical protein KDI19_11035 [Pseudomonadales bacterium]|nr:hypothetical protein [Pseudomonadales bacterium]
MRRLLTLLLTTALAFTATADPLFESDAPLALTVTADLSKAERERDKEAKYPGTVQISGKQFEVDVELRGNRRLNPQICRHPPLRLDFRKKEIDDTLLDHQNDIKLVVQCQPGSRFADYVRAEFLVYKAMNLLTPLSYRVRWVDATFVDTSGRGERTEGAFFVERKSRLAKRNELDAADLQHISVDQLAAKHAALVNLFQYVIANPDYSLIAPPPGDDCCHNAKLLTDGKGTFEPVIYDFDSAGVVDASYAVPAAGLGIRRVTDRTYRGYCIHNEALTGARAALLQKAQQIIGLFRDDPLLGTRQKNRSTRFLEKSFEHLTKDRLFERYIVSRCR